MSERKLSDRFTYAIKQWITDFPPQRSGMQLRIVFLEYLFFCQRHGLPKNFFEVLNNVHALFELLDAADAEAEGWKEEEAEEIAEAA